MDTWWGHWFNYISPSDLHPLNWKVAWSPHGQCYKMPACWYWATSGDVSEDEETYHSALHCTHCQCRSFCKSHCRASEDPRNSATGASSSLHSAGCHTSYLYPDRWHWSTYLHIWPTCLSECHNALCTELFCGPWTESRTHSWSSQHF